MVLEPPSDYSETVMNFERFTRAIELMREKRADSLGKGFLVSSEDVIRWLWLETLNTTVCSFHFGYSSLLVPKSTVIFSGGLGGEFT